MINAEPRVYTGIQIFRLGAEACFFEAMPPVTALREALDDAFRKNPRWWCTLQEITAIRSSSLAASAASAASHQASSEDGRGGEHYPQPEEEIEFVLRGHRGNGKTVSSSSAGLEFVALGPQTPALFDDVLVRYRGTVRRGVVRRLSSHASGGLQVGLGWGVQGNRPIATAGARAEREAELRAAEDLSFFLEFYGLEGFPNRD